MTDTKILNYANPKSFPVPPVELIKDILYKPLVTTIWGEPGTGKSHIAMDLACVIAQQYPILYVAAEAPYEMSSRITSWKTYYSGDVKENFNIWPEPLLLMLEKEVKDFIIAANEVKPTVIFIDPLAQCFAGGNENETKDMAIITYHLNLICRTIKCAVCLIAHSGWNDAHERGSSVLRGFNRCSIKVTKTDDRIKLVGAKENYGIGLKERQFTILQIGPSVMDTVIVPYSPVLEDENTESCSDRQIQVLTELNKPMFSKGVSRIEFIKYLTTSCSIPSSSAYEAYNSLIKKELIELKSSNMIGITDAGLTILEFQPSIEKSAKIPMTNFNWILTDSNPFQPNSNSIPMDSNDKAFPQFQSSSEFSPLKGGNTGMDGKEPVMESKKVN